MALSDDATDLSKALAKPSAPQRSLTYFTDLNPTDNSKFIEARVYRKWTSMKVPNFIATGFSCILLDKKGSAIQANTDLKEKERFERDLLANHVYRIEGFGFEKTDNWAKTLDNDITLCFGKHTQIQHLEDEDFPFHYFDFAAYNQLGPRLEKKNPILTDYIGYVQNVEKVKEYGTATSNKVKVRNIGIRNLNNNVVIFTLWNENADNFPEAEYAEMKQPVILAVSSCYLKRHAGQLQLSATAATFYYFNPPINETAELIAAYSENNTTAPRLEIQTEKLTDWEQERTRNRVPLQTLLLTDAKTQQRVSFTQDAMILRISTAYDWYFQKCDECGGKLNYGFIHGHCHPYGTDSNPQVSYSFRIVITDGTGNAEMTCFSPHTDGLIKPVEDLLKEVDDKDPSVIPPQIFALQNTRHTFQFRYGNQAGKGPPTFVLEKIMDHPPAILPPMTEGSSSVSNMQTPTEGPASAPTSPPDTHSYAHTSPPPVTPLTAQETATETPAKVRPDRTSTARKELFAPDTEEDTSRNTKKQKNE